MSIFRSVLSLADSKVLRYIIAGGTAAAVNLSILFVLTEYVGLWYLFSAVIAVASAWIVSFTLQKFWTFKDRSMDRLHIQAPLHLTVSLANIVVNTGLLYIFVEYIHMWYLAGQVLSGALLAIVDYFIYKHYIFAKRSSIGEVGVA